MDSDNSSEDPIYRFLLEKDDQEPDLDDGVRDMDGKTGLELNQGDFSQSQANQETLNGDHYYDVPGNLIESININIDVPKDTEAIELYQGQMNKIDSEFKHLKYFYFHNCIYGKVWENNQLQYEETTDLQDVLNKYNKDYRLIMVGDASMAEYELMASRGMMDDSNERTTGKDFLRRLANKYPNHI